MKKYNKLWIIAKKEIKEFLSNKRSLLISIVFSAMVLAVRFMDESYTVSWQIVFILFLAASLLLIIIKSAKKEKIITAID